MDRLRSVECSAPTAWKVVVKLALKAETESGGRRRRSNLRATMYKILDQVIAIDLSMTCWPGDPPPGQVSEIIEIGVCPLEVRSGRILDKRSIIVKPRRSSVSPLCTSLTGITPEDAERGLEFGAACAALEQDYLCRHRPWTSYGNQIRRVIKKQCRRDAAAYPFGASHINIKTMAAVFRALGQEVGLVEILRTLNLPLEGDRHRAADRARNAAILLSKLIIESRMKYLSGTN